MLNLKKSKLYIIVFLSLFIHILNVFKTNIKCVFYSLITLTIFIIQTIFIILLYHIKGIIGFANVMYSAVTHARIKDGDDDQRFYTSLFLNKKLNV